MVLDEAIDSLAALLAARRDGVADGVTIKIARVGGVTRAAAIRDVAVELGLTVTVEDTGGADDRHRRHGAPLALDARAAPDPHRRLHRLGHRRQRRGAAGAAPAGGSPRRTRPGWA